jgi:hypothetical protein
MYSRFISSGSTDETGPDLISLADLKAELEITDDSEDAVLASRITRWSRMFAEYCGRSFAFEEGVETFTFECNEVARPSRPLVLSLYPVVDVVSVTVNGSAVEYEVNAEAGLLYLKAGYWSGTVEVTYSGGYILPSGAPPGLVEAIISQMRDSRENRDASVQTVAHGDSRVSYFNTTTSVGQVSLEVASFLAPFRRPVIA